MIFDLRAIWTNNVKRNQLKEISYLAQYVSHGSMPYEGGQNRIIVSANAVAKNLNNKKFTYKTCSIINISINTNEIY